MSEKKYSPKEVALAILAQAAKVAQSVLAKSEMPDANGKEPMKKDMGGDMGDMAGGSDMAMSEQAPPANGSGEPKMKGHIKLAKFVGRMEHKRGKPAGEMDKSQEDPSKMSGKTGMLATAESGHEKGVNVKGNQGRSQGISEAGASTRNASHMGPKANGNAISSAKESHKQVLGEMKAMPKPKLPA